MKVNSSVASAASAGMQSGRMIREVLPHDARAVDPGRLGQRLRNRLHVVGEHEGAEARLERHVDRDQPDVRVVEDPLSESQDGSGSQR